jgi:predicted transcriptional regulator
VDDDNKILGIIAQADVVMHFDHPKKAAAMVKDISQTNTR